MYKLSGKDIEYYLENIPGVVVIDMKGIVRYVNEQCAAYFGLEKKTIMEKHILEVFPKSKMIEGLERDEPELVFYSSYLGIGITIQVPLFKDGEKIGLLEYDATQNSERLYELSKGYSKFLDAELKNIEKEIVSLTSSKYSLANIIGTSKAVVKMREEIIAASKTNSTVLITGETGTGKELVAHAIHELSGRRGNRIVKINASAFPENLVESELFGYEEGSFTGAKKGGKKGKFELANKGTLFIDEINQMPLNVQPKLLRVLQEKEVDPIGSDKTIPIDVRVIAASNENLLTLVGEGKFREDLYYRFNVLGINIPPLRDRKEDIEALANYKIDELNLEMSMDIEGITEKGIKYLQSYDWPGNIRELYNSIERAMNFAKGNVLTEEDFDLILSGKEHFEDYEAKNRNNENMIEAVRNSAEKNLIVSALNKHEGNRTKTAQYLGIARPLLYQKMKRLKIKE